MMRGCARTALLWFLRECSPCPFRIDSGYVLTDLTVSIVQLARGAFTRLLFFIIMQVLAALDRVISRSEQQLFVSFGMHTWGDATKRREALLCSPGFSSGDVIVSGFVESRVDTSVLDIVLMKNVFLVPVFSVHSHLLAVRRYNHGGG